MFLAFPYIRGCIPHFSYTFQIFAISIYPDVCRALAAIENIHEKENLTALDQRTDRMFNKDKLILWILSRLYAINYAFRMSYGSDAAYLSVSSFIFETVC